MFHVFGVLAEFERNLILARTLAGQKAARARGRRGARPRKLSPKDLKTVRALLRSGDVPVSTIAEQFRVARPTLYRNAGASPQRASSMHKVKVDSKRFGVAPAAPLAQQVDAQPMNVGLFRLRPTCRHQGFSNL